MVLQQHAEQTMPAMASFFARTLGGGEPPALAPSAPPPAETTPADTPTPVVREK
jgi:hypothetical protein